MQCTECGQEFTPDHLGEEICQRCQVQDVPEATQRFIQEEEGPYRERY